MCSYLGGKTGKDNDATAQVYSSSIVGGVGVSQRGESALPGAGAECTMILTLSIRTIVRSAISASWRVVSTAR